MAMFKKRYKLTRIDFEEVLDEGQNPLGFTAQTKNGCAHWKGTGYNKDGLYGCVGFRQHRGDWTSYGDDDLRYGNGYPGVPEGGPWQGGRSNRTGE